MKKHLTKSQYLVFSLYYSFYLSRKSLQFMMNGKFSPVREFGRAIADARKEG